MVSFAIRAARIERKPSAAAKWAGRIAWFSLVLLITAVALHGFGFIETIPFFWTVVLAGGLATLGLLTAILAFWRMWEYGFTGFWSAFWGLLISVLVLAPYGIAGVLYVTRPALTDVMTDVVTPPEFALAPALRQPPMNPIGPLSQAAGLEHMEAYPELAGRRYEQPREQVMAALMAVLDQKGWERLGSSDETGEVIPEEAADGEGRTVVEAAATAPILGLPFDAAIRVEERDNATFVDMRVVSRYGSHDLGFNAMEIQSFLRDLDEALTEMAGG
jgi:Protein of unknown function (DUF1499).